MQLGSRSSKLKPEAQRHVLHQWSKINTRKNVIHRWSEMYILTNRVNTLILVPFVEASWNYIRSAMTFIQYNCTMHFTLPSDLVLLPPSAGEPVPCALGPSYPPLRWRHWLWPQHSPWQEISPETSAWVFSWCVWLRKNISFGIDVWWCWFGSKSTADSGLNQKTSQTGNSRFCKFKVTSRHKTFYLQLKRAKLGLSMRKLGWSQGSSHSFFEFVTWIFNLLCLALFASWAQSCYHLCHSQSEPLPRPGTLF